jgi:hypothetical protein
MRLTNQVLSGATMFGAVLQLSCDAARPPQIAEPDYLWTVSASADTRLTMPTSVSVQLTAERNLVLVADVQRRGVVVLDGSTGTLVRTVQVLDSDTPDIKKFFVPYTVATSPSGHLTAVYDIGYQAIILLDKDLNFLRAIRLDHLVLNPKDMDITDDAMVVLTGGSVSPDSAEPSIHWIRMRTGEFSHTGPSLAEIPGSSKHGRALVAGGAIHRLSASVALFGEAVTGSVFMSTPRRVDLVLADARAHHANVVTRVVQDVSEGEDRPRTTWWSFPRAIMLWPDGDTSYRMLWTDPEAGLLQLLRMDPDGRSVIGSWRISATMAKRFDRESIVVVHGSQSGAMAVSRIRIGS